MGLAGRLQPRFLPGGRAAATPPPTRLRRGLHHPDSASTEREDVAAERVAPGHLLHQARQPVEALAHAGRACGEPHPHARRWASHATSSAAARHATAVVSVVSATRSRTRPLRGATSTTGDAAARGSVALHRALADAQWNAAAWRV